MKNWQLVIQPTAPIFLQVSASSSLLKSWDNPWRGWLTARRQPGSSTVTPGPSPVPAPPSCCSSSAASPSSSSPCLASPRTPGRPAWMQNPSTEVPCAHQKYPHSVRKRFVFFKMSGSHHTMCSLSIVSHYWTKACSIAIVAFSFPLFFHFFFSLFFDSFLSFLFFKKAETPLNTIVGVCEWHCSVPIWGCPVLMQLRGNLCLTQLRPRGDSFVREKSFGGSITLGIDPWGISGFYTSLGQRETLGTQCPHLCHTPLLPSEGSACFPRVSWRSLCSSIKMLTFDKKQNRTLRGIGIKIPPPNVHPAVPFFPIKRKTPQNRVLCFA